MWRRSVYYECKKPSLVSPWVNDMKMKCPSLALLQLRLARTTDRDKAALNLCFLCTVQGFFFQIVASLVNVKKCNFKGHFFDHTVI